MNEILNSQSDALNISDFLSSAEKYTQNVFSDLDITELFSNAISGSIGNIFEINNIFDVFLQEFSEIITLMISIVTIIIIHSIFKTIIENLGNSNASKVVYFVQYLIIVTIITNNFVTILDLTKDCINNIVGFMNLFIPLLLTLMLTTGSLVTTTITEPILIFMVNFIGNFISSFLIPFLLVSITISIISNISKKISIDKLSKFMKSSIIWILGIILTIFSCTLSIEGTLSSSVDGMTGKTAKAAVSTFIPVVGKILGDTVDSVIGCGNILKNSVGIIGIIVIIGIVLIPIIKIGILWFSFKLTSAVCEVIADKKIISLIEEIGDSYKILFAILISVSIMFVIGITLVLKITNTALMYR